MSRVATIVASCLLTTSFLLAAEDPPDNWRRATAAESAEEWRAEDPERYFAVRGDFDSDGKEDRAELLLSLDGERCSLFVLLASKSKGWQQVGEDISMGGCAEFGIARVEPGRYKTACGKGYGEYACSRGEPDVLELKASAVAVFALGSASQYVFWDVKSKKIRQILISD